jgi:hypothetical protein
MTLRWSHYMTLRWSHYMTLSSPFQCLSHRSIPRSPRSSE